MHKSPKFSAVEILCKVCGALHYVLFSITTATLIDITTTVVTIITAITTTLLK
jgi:hypothetical protein